MRIEGNATYVNRPNPNDQSTWRTQSLYTETPKLNIIDPGGLNIQIVEKTRVLLSTVMETPTTESPLEEIIDLYIDDRMPNEFYYGFGRGDTYLPAMGGKIKISEAVPGSTLGHAGTFEKTPLCIPTKTATT